MSKILYILYPSLLLILFNVINIAALSQTVTNDSITNSSSVPTSNRNESKTITVIDAVGDMDCSNNLLNQVKKDNPTYLIALGDLCYKKDLTNFTNTYAEFKKENKLACIIGNHDAEENGNLIILNETRKYCGDHWYLKVANDTTLLIGLNTNGDSNLQAQWGKSLVKNSTLMKGVKNVLILGHKPAHTPPKSHHPVENSTIQMFSAIETSISKSIQVYEIAAHNHFMAESSNGQWFISGAGGRSHYEGTTDSAWPFVNTNEYGYLQIKINNTDGKTLSPHFYGLDGKLIH
jgi:predicted phosphodiesterase